MTTPVSVLLIDDSPEDRQLYRRFLEQSSTNYIVHEAADGASGLEAVARLQPDCVLLDLRLNGESGYEVLHTLVEQNRRPTLPVIMLTGATWKALEAGARSLGASGYLVKGTIDAPGLDREIRSAMLRAMTTERPDTGRRAEHQ